MIGALTIPTLINNIQDKQYRSSLKKNYSAFNQALRFSYGYNYDNFTDWKYAHSLKGAEDLVSNLSKYMSIAKICGHSDGSCFVTPTYSDGSKLVTGFKAGNDEAYSFVLSDGTSVVVDIWASYNVSSIFGVTENYLSPTFAYALMIDVNGVRKPNIIGKDVFAFVLTKKGFVPAGLDSKNYTKWGLTAKYLQES